MENQKQQNEARIGGSGLSAGLGGEMLAEKILCAQESLGRILAKFDGSENHKQIRMLRKRVLKKLLKEAAYLTRNV